MTFNIITSRRLILRSARDTDLDSLYDIVFSVPEVMFHTFGGKPFSKHKSADFFANSFDHDGNGKQPGVLTLKDSGTIIGFAGLMECFALGQRDYEIGFVLSREYWGKGYASEIGLGQIKYGFEVVGCSRLLALVAPKNDPSRATLDKIGMTYHSTIDTDFRGEREIYVATRENRKSL